MEDKQKRIIVILMVLTIIFTISGGTLAYWTWTTNESQKTAVTFTATQDFSCAADGGGSITSGDAFIAPTNCSWDPVDYDYNPNPHVIERTITVTPTILRDGLTVSMDLWLNVNSIDVGLSNSKNFKYQLTGGPGVCNRSVISSGTFYGRTVGDKVMLLDQKEYSSSEPQTYYLHIWLDAAETSASTMDQSFSFSLGGECTDEEYPKAYAVYSSDDKSLRFYKTTEKITEGSTYNGLTVTKVYTNFEKEVVDEMPPWIEMTTSVENIVVEDEISPISTAYWFSNFYVIKNINLTKLNTSNVTDMGAMFGDTGNISSIDFSKFDTSKVENMSNMFCCSTTIYPSNNLSQMNTSRVIDMSYMFEGASLSSDFVTDLDLSEWDVSNVTNYEYFGDDASNNFGVKIIPPIWLW